MYIFYLILVDRLTCIYHYVLLETRAFRAFKSVCDACGARNRARGEGRFGILATRRCAPPYLWDRWGTQFRIFCGVQWRFGELSSGKSTLRPKTILFWISRIRLRNIHFWVFHAKVSEDMFVRYPPVIRYPLVFDTSEKLSSWPRGRYKIPPLFSTLLKQGRGIL